jgi:hypothetical protein
VTSPGVRASRARSRARARIVLALSSALSLAIGPARASADPGAADPPNRAEGAPRATTSPLTFHADQLDADAGAYELSLRGRVEVGYERYRLWAETLRLSLHDGVVVFSGDVRAAACPCAGTPVTFLASGGRFEPPGDLVLLFPRVALGGVPVFALPVLWVRAPDRVGLLAPILEVRGSDGVLLGSGVHLPWREAEGLEYLDVTAAGYVRGGAELGGHLATAGSDTRIVADWISGTRVALEGHGALVARGDRAFGVAWATDALRGDRALAGTTDLAAAARPFDTGAAQVSMRAETGAGSAILGAGVEGRALRGLGAIAAGPRVTMALGGPARGLGSWSADAGFATLGDQAHAVSLGRASAAGEIDARPGPFELRASAAARARFAGGASPDGTATEAATAARADLELPFARSFPVRTAEPAEAPLVHWIAPALTVRGALAAERGSFFAPIGGAAPPSSWMSAAGLSTALGRAQGSSLRLDLRAGATGVAGATEGLAHARIGADARVVALAVESAAVADALGRGSVPEGAPLTAGAVPSPRASSAGAAVLGRARFGDAAGPWVRVEAAAQTGAGAGEARAVARDAWAALPGDALAYLRAPGWTGATEVFVPWGRGVSTGARADVDLDARTLLAVRATGAYRHPCGCFALGVVAAHRVGRDGVDAALTVDVAPPSGPRAP